MKVLIATYTLFILLFVVFTYFFIDLNFIYLSNIYSGIAYSNRLLVSILYGVFIIGFFGFYIYFLSYSKRQKLDYKQLRFLFLPTALLLFSYPAILSYDIFNYLATAKVTFFYVENPYLVMPVEFLNDTMLMYTRAANKYALYGPSWIILTSVPFFLSFGNILFQILLLKVLVAVFYIGTLFVLYRLTKNYYSVVFFGLNPLVVIETFVSGHNDIVMVFFMLLGLYLLKEKRVASSFISLFVSIFIKFASVFLLPIWLYVLYNRFINKEIIWNKVWIASFFLMLFVFLLSPIREELYPWYFIWVLPFVSLIHNKKLSLLFISLSFGLLLYYIPYMYTGYYLIALKVIFVIIPTIIFYMFLKYSFKKSES